MIRAHVGRPGTRSAARAVVFVAVIAGLAVAACGSTTPSGSPGSSTPPSTAASAEPSVPATESAVPTATPEATPPDVSPTPGEATPTPSTGVVLCTGTIGNRAFYEQAASVMSWAVYCPVLTTGWYVETGDYRLAAGGHLEITYRGPGDAHLAMAEGNICYQTTDVDTCAPRDMVIGPAAFGDQDGELGRLSNGLVLDVNRGGNPSWRVTGIGLSEADFSAICAAMYHVPPGLN